MLFHGTQVQVPEGSARKRTHASTLTLALGLTPTHQPPEPKPLFGDECCELVFETTASETHPLDEVSHPSRAGNEREVQSAK